MASREPDHTGPRRHQEMAFGLVSEEEFESEQGGHGGTGRIAAGELGQHAQGTAKEGGLVGREPKVDTAQVARLARPSGPYPGNGLPNETLVMDVERHNGKRRSGIEPAIHGGEPSRREDGRAVELSAQTGCWESQRTSEIGRIDQAIAVVVGGGTGGMESFAWTGAG
jgi:hypothetical protein